MSTITDNQRASNQTQANDALRRLIPAMTRLCEPQKAAMLAMLAAATNTPIDLVMLGVKGDDEECHRILDGNLPSGMTRHSWLVGSGCQFILEMLPREEDATMTQGIHPVLDIPLPNYGPAWITCKTCGKTFYGFGGRRRKFPSPRWRHYAQHWLASHSENK